MESVIPMAPADVQMVGMEKIAINVFHYQVVMEVAQTRMNVFALQVLKGNIVMKVSALFQKWIIANNMMIVTEISEIL
uniref:Uncharacterized protein n=1 Tax=Panagrolaimus superbus TaxID=310955 RepID=A0A914YXY6_9BILA